MKINYIVDQNGQHKFYSVEYTEDNLKDDIRHYKIESPHKLSVELLRNVFDSREPDFDIWYQYDIGDAGLVSGSVKEFFTHIILDSYIAENEN